MLSSDFAEISLEVKPGGIGWLTLKREKSLNALTWTMVDELSRAIDQLRSSPQTRCLVITGDGRAFCAGADLKALGALESIDLLNNFIKAAGILFDAIEGLPFPTIAALNGTTMAGGLELALCCDLMVASASVKIADGHTKFGQIPGGGATVRLPERIGLSRSKYLMYSGSSISAEQALDWGLVDQLFEGDALVRGTLELATTIASRSPLGLKSIKSLMSQGQGSTRRAGLDAELDECSRYFQSHDQREGMAAFSEKRDPSYIGA